MLRIESSAFFIRSIRLLEMKVTAAQAAQACYDLYDYGIEPSKTQWDFISMTGADCYYGVTMVGPTALCCFRGTSTLPDLLRAIYGARSPAFKAVQYRRARPRSSRRLARFGGGPCLGRERPSLERYSIHRAQPGRHARHARDRRFCGHLCDRDGSAADRFWRMQVRLYQERAVCRHPRQRVFPSY